MYLWSRELKRELPFAVTSEEAPTSSSTKLAVSDPAPAATLAASSSSPINLVPSPSSSIGISAPISERSSPLPIKAIIAGSVSGGLSLVLIALLFWLCLRRKRNKRLTGGNSTGSLVERKGPYVPETNGNEERQLRSSESSITPPGGLQSSQTLIRPESNDSRGGRLNYKFRPLGQKLHDDTEDVALPDAEKSSISAPPLEDHPAFQKQQLPEANALHHSAELRKTCSHPLPHSAILNTSPEDRNRYSDSHASLPFRKARFESRSSDSMDSLSSLPSQKLNRYSAPSNGLRRQVDHSPRQEIDYNKDLHRLKSSSVVQHIINSPVLGNFEQASDGSRKPRDMAYQATRLRPTSIIAQGKVEANLRFKHSLVVDTPSAKPTRSQLPHLETNLPILSAAEADIGLQNQPNTTGEDSYHPSPRSAKSPLLKLQYYPQNPVSEDTATSFVLPPLKTQFNKMEFDSLLPLIGQKQERPSLEPRWSGSTVAYEDALPTEPSPTYARPLSPTETVYSNGISPSIYSQDCGSVKYRKAELVSEAPLASEVHGEIVWEQVELTKQPCSIVNTPLEMKAMPIWV